MLQSWQLQHTFFSPFERVQDTNGEILSRQGLALFWGVFVSDVLHPAYVSGRKKIRTVPKKMARMLEWFVKLPTSQLGSFTRTSQNGSFSWG